MGRSARRFRPKEIGHRATIAIATFGRSSAPFISSYGFSFKYSSYLSIDMQTTIQHIITKMAGQGMRLLLAPICLFTACGTQAQEKTFQPTPHYQQRVAEFDAHPAADNAPSSARHLPALWRQRPQPSALSARGFRPRNAAHRDPSPANPADHALHSKSLAHQ